MNNNEQEHFENQIEIPLETLEQLKKEVTEYATRKTKTLLQSDSSDLDCLSEEFLSHFQQIYNINLNIAILQIQNPYHNTPCEDCWCGCDSDYYDANSGRLWYCPRNT